MEREQSPVDIVSNMLDDNKYIIIPTDSIGCISPIWKRGDDKQARTDVVELRVEIDRIRVADKITIVLE